MESNIGWLLSRAALSWRTVVDQHMAELGLTQTRWIALLHLKRVGEGCTQSALAANIGVEQSSMLRTVNQLLEAGLIERRASADDGRCRTLWLTDAGKALLVDVEQLAFKGRQQLLAGLDTQQRQQFHDLLAHIIINAHTVLMPEQP